MYQNGTIASKETTDAKTNKIADTFKESINTRVYEDSNDKTRKIGMFSATFYHKVK